MRSLAAIFLILYAVGVTAQIPEPIKCSATTKAGTQCTRNASEGSSLCWQHGKKLLVSDSTSVKSAASTQCTATTKAGNRCRNMTKSGDLCRVHVK